MSRNLAVNTTETVSMEKEGSRPATETLEQGIEKIREVFAKSRRMDIRIPAIEGADRLGNTIEGGVNGYMFALQRGADIPNVPEPIVEVLKNAGIGFSELGSWKDAEGAL